MKFPKVRLSGAPCVTTRTTRCGLSLAEDAYDRPTLVLGGGAQGGSLCPAAQSAAQAQPLPGPSPPLMHQAGATKTTRAIGSGHGRNATRARPRLAESGATKGGFLAFVPECRRWRLQQSNNFFESLQGL